MVVDRHHADPSGVLSSGTLALIRASIIPVYPARRPPSMNKPSALRIAGLCKLRHRFSSWKISRARGLAPSTNSPLSVMLDFSIVSLRRINTDAIVNLQ